MENKEENSVSEYLKNNPDFVKRWVKKNVEVAEIKEWTISLEKTPRESFSFKQAADSAISSNKRKGILKSVLKNELSDYLERKRKTSATQRKNKDKLLSLSDKELLLELIKDVSNELDVDVLCHKILVNVSILTRSDRGSLFLRKGKKEQSFLASRLFDVTADSTLAESFVPEEKQIKVPFGTGIAGHVAETKETINIKDAYQVCHLKVDVIAVSVQTLSGNKPSST